MYIVLRNCMYGIERMRKCLSVLTAGRYANLEQRRGRAGRCTELASGAKALSQHTADSTSEHVQLAGGATEPRELCGRLAERVPAERCVDVD